MTNQTFPGNAGDQPFYRLILFVAGNEPHSLTARTNLNVLCDQELKGRCEVEIVDVLENFALASKHDIVLTPTLLVVHPEPSVMVIGSLSDRRKVLTALNLPEESYHAP
jgi:circadian clock protein KaiB